MYVLTYLQNLVLGKGWNGFLGSLVRNSLDIYPSDVILIEEIAVTTVIVSPTD